MFLCFREILMTSLELLTEHITVQDDLKIAKTFFLKVGFTSIIVVMSRCTLVLFDAFWDPTWLKHTWDRQPWVRQNLSANAEKEKGPVIQRPDPKTMMPAKLFWGTLTDMGSFPLCFVYVSFTIWEKSASFNLCRLLSLDIVFPEQSVTWDWTLEILHPIFQRDISAHHKMT